MGKYYIEDAKCDVVGGPLNSSVLASIKYTDGEKTNWLTNWEYDGFPQFFLTQEDLFDRIADGDIDEDMEDELDNLFCHEFEGIVLGDYETIFALAEQNPTSDALSLIRYLIAITRCDPEDTKDIISNGIGKDVSELDIPLSDLELEYKGIDDDE